MDKLALQATALRYFLVLAEELHFGRAAERLGVSQPQMSQKIRQLEGALGFALFERTSRKTQLTDAGLVLADAARRSAAELDRGLMQARQQWSGALGSIAIGYVSTAMLMGLHVVVQRFRQAHAQVRLSLRELSTEDQHELLRSGGLDMAFVSGTPDDPAIVQQKSWRQDLLAVLPEHHPRSRLGAAGRARAVTMESLAREPFVLFPSLLARRQYGEFIQLCEGAGFAPLIVQEAETWHAILGLVAAGMGVTVAPAVTRRLSWPGVRFHPIAKGPHRTTVALCTRRGAISPTIQSLIDMTKLAVD
jgi:DNA-binding transcriptional LysR family regulator